MKDLLALPCMQLRPCLSQLSEQEGRESRYAAAQWRADYEELAGASVEDQIAILDVQNMQMQRSMDEADPDVGAMVGS